jgi:poly-gamma-glutamate synthesis protein (capsule biosynthesis protein)
MKSVCITTLVFLVFLVHSNCGLLASTTTLLFAGDVMGNKPQVNAAFDPVTQQYDYKPCFQYMKPIIEDATIAIANLEVTLPGEPPYTGFPRFRTPDALVDGLKFAGFDVLVTANNHSNDSGHQGVSHTIDAIKQRNLLQTGTFASQADRDLYCPLVFWVNDFKLALLNYTFHTNGLSTEAPGIVNRIDANAIKNDIAAAQLQNADLIIVFFHWGTECVNYENAYQQQWAQTAANLGADLIIGAHPHVVQPIKTVKTTRADGTEAIVPVVYSLGNFISNAISTNTSIGQIVKVNLMRHPTTCQAYFDQLLYLPVWRYPEDGQLGTTNELIIPCQLRYLPPMHLIYYKCPKPTSNNC